MKEKVKLRIIDAMLEGKEICVLHGYRSWVLASIGSDYYVDGDNLFGWKRDTTEPLPAPRAAPTLKEALEIVDTYWHVRVKDWEHAHD